ncbi:HAMP domain-containing sensor histidine kinase [Lysinibacillus sp. CNPSo 3705]|uniref:sensor histidine kinase n=1 Tax=Lysinibacillus sp. CNPSo 3705 TaxID=3028148 RepID=UPI0010CF62A2|nr:HAMP domain-containing sensor histidine kinase [Lysinibacillus sp. CNPSo 3705]MDD1504969.1 HAMP domain-containing sensor histidine kinase [Lysinibacillus sp. CNPSo 3705]
MKNRHLTISGKFFLYSLGLLLILLVICFFFFYSQLKNTVEITQRQQVSKLFASLIDTVQYETDEIKIIEMTKQFSEENRSFDFAYISNDGDILFKTPKFDSDNIPHIVNETPIIKDDINTRFIERTGDNSKTVSRESFILTLKMANKGNIVISNTLRPQEVIKTMLPTMSKIFIVLLVICLLASFFFSKIITSPIKKIASDTKKMALLEEVEPPTKRVDEIGELSEDIYSMHLRLKQTIEDLQKEIALVKKMEENQRYFFSAVSHELKTPIASSMSLIEGIIDGVIEKEDYSKQLDNLLSIQQHQATLVNELLMIVNMDNPDFIVQKESIHLASFFDTILEKYRILIDEQMLKVECSIDNALFIKSDKKLLSKIFSNLLLNAIQNTKAGEKITVFSKICGKSIELEIINTGTKIPHKILKDIANPFFSTDNVRTSSIGKSGLGLTIVQKALTIQGFDFRIENIDKGVCVTIIF